MVGNFLCSLVKSICPLLVNFSTFLKVRSMPLGVSWMEGSQMFLIMPVLINWRRASSLRIMGYDVGFY